MRLSNTIRHGWRVGFGYGLLRTSALFATYFGNPAQPILQTDGIIISPARCWSLRAGFMVDDLYRQRYQREFDLDHAPISSSYVKLFTEAATATLNFKNWLDVNVLLGSARAEIDHDGMKRRFAWGVGTKFLIYQGDSLYLGFDLKYFESDQRPVYFCSDGHPYNVVSDVVFNYSEQQAGIGAAYQIDKLCPYVYATYLYSKISPCPNIIVVRSPFYPENCEIPSWSIVTKRRWGMVVGSTLISGSKGSLSLESRFFNQNALNLSGELRF